MPFHSVLFLFFSVVNCYAPFRFVHVSTPAVRNEFVKNTLALSGANMCDNYIVQDGVRRLHKEEDCIVLQTTIPSVENCSSTS